MIDRITPEEFKELLNDLVRATLYASMTPERADVYWDALRSMDVERLRWTLVHAKVACNRFPTVGALWTLSKEYTPVADTAAWREGRKKEYCSLRDALNTEDPSFFINGVRHNIRDEWYRLSPEMRSAFKVL